MTPRKRLNHDAPYWIAADSDYFLTLCAEPRGPNHFCKDVIGPALLDAAKLYNAQQVWWCHVIVLTPDHLHMLVSFPPEKTMSQVVGLWKRALARKLAVNWQRNYFDHRIRNDANDYYKSEYVLNNPVRAGFVEKWQDWPYYWMPEGR